MSATEFKISGNILDVLNRRVYRGEIFVQNGKIASITKKDHVQDIFIVPGLVDAHVHIESSLLTPSEFAVNALRHGVLAAVTDPHEIANVCGIDGIKFMANSANDIPFYFKIGAPSCVPATNLESSGACISSSDIEYLLKNNICSHLSEMMNFPGVINDDIEVLNKINSAKKFKLPIDGHAPLLTGSALKKYVDAGISTDHECTNIDEALEKLSLGLHVIIREGSAANNLDNLKGLIHNYNHLLMLCSDDVHADNILSGYLKTIFKKLVAEGFDIFDIFKIITVNACRHYNIPLGLLQVGDNADFLILDSIEEFSINSVFVKGIEVSNCFSHKPETYLNCFNCNQITNSDIKVPALSDTIRCIGIIDKELLTDDLICSCKIEDGLAIPDLESDILKIVIVNRYQNVKPGVGFVKGYGLKRGAVATSISHDSHNIICIGTTDDEICKAMNTVILAKGGICYFIDNEYSMLELPIAGLMSGENIGFVANRYLEIESKVKNNGCSLRAPLMNLSFLSLLVIPKLKISDRGLFDFSKFSYTDLFV